MNLTITRRDNRKEESTKIVKFRLPLRGFHNFQAYFFFLGRIEGNDFKTTRLLRLDNVLVLV